MTESRGGRTDASDALAERLARRASSFLPAPLSASQVAQLDRFLHLLERWNRTINLTSLSLQGFPDRTIDRLIGEPLVAAAHVQDTEAAWLDLGSGGGSPAIPLKIARPLLRLTMVESRVKKSAFLREAIRTLGLEAAAVVTTRADILPPSGDAALVTVRAIRLDEPLRNVVRSLLRRGGRLFLFASADDKTPGELTGFEQTAVFPLPGEGGELRILTRL